MSSVRAVVKGVGHYLPERVVTNSEFESLLDTSDEWIRSRTGIEARHFASDGESTSRMAAAASRSALSDSGVDPDEIDLVVLATSTPDSTFPSTATQVQGSLGITGGFAFDLQAVCAGFVYAMASANSMLVAKQASCALVVGAETFSKILDMSDRKTCVLFGDGAGAVVLKAENSSEPGEDRGILATDIRSDGRFRDLLYVDGGVSTTQTAGHLRMDGPEIFKHAVSKLVSTTRDLMGKSTCSIADIDLVVPHQANIRIIRATAKRLGFPEDKVAVTLDKHGNTSAASIPLALSVNSSSGRLRKGDLVVLNAIGGGLTWGSILLRW